MPFTAIEESKPNGFTLFEEPKEPSEEIKSRQVVKNDDGSFSTERTITVTDQRINGGKPTNIPTMFDGKQVSEEMAIDIISKNKGVDPETNRVLIGYDSIEEAVQDAKARSEKLGDSLTKFTPIEEEGSAITDSLKQVYSGFNKGVLSLPKAVLDVFDYFSGGPVTQKLREPLEAFERRVTADPKTTVGGVVGSITQFAVPFGLASKGLTSLKIADGFRKSMAAGVIADFTAFDPEEQRLSDWLVKFDNPVLNNSVTQYLAHDEDDSRIESRIKNVLEGGGLGAAVEGFIRSLKIVKGYKRARIAAVDEIVAKESLPEVVAKQITPDDGKLLTPKVKVEATENAIKAVEEQVIENFDKATQISKQVAKAIGLKEIGLEQGAEIAAKYGITPKQLAEELVNTASYAGRILNRYSQIAKKARGVLPDDAVAVFDKAAKEQGDSYLLDVIAHGIRKVENFRRGLLVTQLTTAVRNVEVQGPRLILAGFDEMLQSAILGAKDPKNLNKLMEGNLNALFALQGPYQRAMKKVAGTKIGESFGIKVKKDALEQIIDAGGHELQMARLLGQPVHEVITKDKGLLWYLNVFNRTQELFFRKIAFEGKLRQLLGRTGQTLDTAKTIPEDMVRQATDYALEMTFAASPKSKVAREFISAWKDVGLTTINPFPRFAFANALPFMYQHSPLGFIDALRYTEYGNKALVKAGKKLGFNIRDATPELSEEFAKYASRATLGTIMMWAGWNMRNSENAGEKWYEINDGEGNIIDTRSYAPFSTYMFFAEGIKDIINDTNKIKIADYAQMLIGLNRISGSGLVIVDLLRAEKPETARKIMADFAGQYMSSFGVPIRQVKDVVAAFSTEEAILRDVRQSPLWAPFVNNIPFASRYLPEGTSPFKSGIDFEGNVHPIRVDVPTMKLLGIEGAPEISAPIARQFFGVTKREKNELEREVDKKGFNRSSLYARTGDRMADRLINGYAGYLNEIYLVPIVESPNYKAMPEPVQNIALKELIRSNKRRAAKMFMANHTNLAIKLKLEDVDDDIKDLIGLDVKEIMKSLEQ